MSLSADSFTLNPGESETITVEFSYPDVDATTFPVLSGFINVNSGSEILHVSYLGLAASLIDKQVLDDTDYWFGFDLPAIVDSSGQIQEGVENYTWIGEGFPSVLWRYAVLIGLRDLIADGYREGRLSVLRY